MKNSEKTLCQKCEYSDSCTEKREKCDDFRTVKKYRWDTPYEKLSKNLKLVLDASASIPSDEWNRSLADDIKPTRGELLDAAFLPLKGKIKLTGDEKEYLTDINYHSELSYLEEAK